MPRDTRQDPVRCPYRKCTVTGTQAEVDDHVTYCTSVLTDDENHRERDLR